MQQDRSVECGELWIRLLGGFSVERLGYLIPPGAWQRRGTAQALVKLLALAPAHRLHRDQILEALWSGLDPVAADRKLRKALHYARRALERDLTYGRASSYLQLHDGMVSLQSDRVRVDVDYFRHAANEALRRDDVGVLEDALELYRGELLPEDRYEDWTARRREEIADLHLCLLLRAADRRAEQGAYPSALVHLQQVLIVDPTREDVHRAIMRLHTRNGSAHAALRQYAVCVEILRRELDVAPDMETEALRLDLMSSRVSVMEPLVGTRAPPLPRAIRRVSGVPFIGRGRALELLTECLTRAEEGAGQLVLVGGEAGVGKTRLVTEVAREGYRRGAVVLQGGSYESEEITPYGAVVDALEGYVVDLPDVERVEMMRAFPEVTRLLPSLAHSGTFPVDLRDNGDKASLFGTFVRLIGHLGTDVPVILVLDDLHAADAASIELLHYLARVVPYERWLIMGTYREEELHAGSPIHRLRTAITRVGMCHRIDLHRLARPETELLVRELLTNGTVSAALHDELYSLSAGNPLFLQELVQTMLERDQLELCGHQWRERGDVRVVPSGVRELVEERVHRLGETVERMLAVAAVAGMEVRFDLLRGATGLDEESLLNVLDQALSAGILEETPAGYVFRHPLVRSALYDRLAQRRRMLLHRMVGRTIEAVLPDVEILAYHFARGGDEAKATEYLELAGDRARAACANSMAETRYRDAIELLETAGRIRDAVRCREKLGAVLTTVTRCEEALQLLEEVAAVYCAEGDREALARVAARLGRAYLYGGAIEEGLERIGLLVQGMETGDPPESLAAVYVAIAMLFFLSGRHGEQLASAQRAERLARQVGDDESLVAALVWQGNALRFLGHVDEALTLLEEALPAASRSADQLTLVTALVNVGTIHAHAGIPGKSVPYLERALELAEAQGDRAQTAYVAQKLAWQLSILGDWKRARACLVRAARDDSHPSSALPYVLCSLAELCLMEGDWEDARRHLENAATLASTTDNVLGLHASQMVKARLEFCCGRVDMSRDRLAALLEFSHLDPVLQGQCLVLLAWTYVELDDPHRAQCTAEAAIESIRRQRNRTELPLALQVLAMALRHQHHFDEAQQALDEGMSLARAIPYPFAEARGLVEWGLLNSARGNMEHARCRFEQARNLFETLGAPRDVERTDQMLKHLSASYERDFR